MSDQRTGRIRMRDRTGNDGAFGHQPPVVVWRCGKTHRLLRVFLSRDGWHVLGDRLRVPLGEWLERIDAGYTVEDLQDGRVVAMGARRVQGVDKKFPVDIDAWSAEKQFDVGCRCGTKRAEFPWLAEDCRKARDTRNQVVRIVP